MQPEQLVGQTLGHYRIIRQIGYGGMSTVFLAEDERLGRQVAVKVFWPRPGETRDFLRRFEREARVLAQLDHPNILPVYDYGEQDGYAYLVTPYMPGGTLKDVLQERKVFPPAQAIQLVTPVLKALQYAFERGLIHRDIKPGNLLFKADGSLVLADFGLVKAFAPDGNTRSAFETLSETGGSITGTPDYMAPEQIEGKASPTSDIYSMGVVLYEMLTGKRPFAADSLIGILMSQMNDMPRPPREFNQFITPQLNAVILRALAKDPAKRYQQPADLLSALTQAVSGSARALDAEQTQATNWLFERNPISQDAPGFGNRQARISGNHYATEPAPAVPVQPVERARPASTPQMTPAEVHWPAQAQWTPPPPTSVAGNGPATQGRNSSRTPLLVAIILLLLATTLVLSLTLTPLGRQLFGAHPGQTPSPGANTPGTTGSPGVTQTVPPTQTGCPAAGTARAAVMVPMSLGHTQTLVYYVNEFSGNTPTFGTLKRLDTKTGSKVEIVKQAHTSIETAQISNDGQWILFTANVSGQEKLGMVRMDGQGLQTLYCSSGGTIMGAQWSIDQKHVIFNEQPGSGTGGGKLYLLDTGNGQLQQEQVPSASGLSYMPRTWLDNSQVLLVGYVPNSDAPPINVFTLDISKQPPVLQTVVSTNSSQRCLDFDSSFDGTKLFVNSCTPGQPEGSSTINEVQVSSPASPRQVFNSSTLAVSSVRVIDKTNTFLLATVSNTGQGISGDTSQDGLYKIKTDGSNTAIRLVPDGNGVFSEMNLYSQYFWSNVSRDLTLYAAENISAQGQRTSYTLFYGSLNGGSPNQFASISDGTALEIVGWTTL